MFGLAKLLGNIERTALRSVCKPCLCTLNLVAVRMYTPGSVRRRFLIPYVYRSKSFNIHTDNTAGTASTAVKRPGDLPEPNDNPHPYTDFEDLEIESYIATDEKSHKLFMDIENQIAEKQSKVNELYEEVKFEVGLAVAQDAFDVLFRVVCDE